MKRALFLLLLAGCSPGSASAPLVAAPTMEDTGQATCKVKKSQLRPLVVEWPSTDRAALEARLREGLVVVRYLGCEMQVLPRCKAEKGAYRFVGVTKKTDHVAILNEDELWANMPIGAAGLHRNRPGEQEGVFAHVSDQSVENHFLQRQDGFAPFIGVLVQGDIAAVFLARVHPLTGASAELVRAVFKLADRGPAEIRTQHVFVDGDELAHGIQGVGAWAMTAVHRGQCGAWASLWQIPGLAKCGQKKPRPVRAGVQV